MELITGNSKAAGNAQLAQLSREALLSATRVDAAVAYVWDNDLLFQECWEKNIPVTLWARYEHSVPVAIPVLEWFLNKSRKSANYACKLIPDIYHPKIIWWHGFGVYIGSANLTSSAWSRNFEAGIFLSEDELDEQEIREDLKQYFEEINAASTPLSQAILEEMNSLLSDPYQKAKAEAERRFEKTRLIPELKPNISITKVPVAIRRRDDFLAEWRETLDIIRTISERVSTDEFRPRWVPEESPKGAQADQFLNAFYYTQVGGTAVGVREFHEANRSNVEAALMKEMKWWKKQEGGPNGEEETLVRWAPLLAEQLRREKLPRLTKEEFSEVCLHVHAMLEHARQTRYESLGLSRPTVQTPKAERCKQLAMWLYDQRSKDGSTTIETLDYVLYGGSIADTPDRIYEAFSNPDRRIPHLGVSSLGELVGWALPNEMPPRNGRTNKALRALGYRVRDFGKNE